MCPVIPPGIEVIPIVGDGLKEWPVVVPGGDHYTCIKEGLEPPGPNDSDYVMTGQYEKVDEYYLGAGVSGKLTIDELYWQFRYSGNQYTVPPDLKIELYVAGIKRAEIMIDVNTDGILWNSEVIFTSLNISGTDWYTGPRIIRHTGFYNGTLIFPPAGKPKAYSWPSE